MTVISERNGSCLDVRTLDVLMPNMTAPSLFRVIEDVREVALAAVLAIVHGSHEDTSTTLSYVSTCASSVPKE